MSLLQDAIKRVETALAEATEGHGYFSCWSGPTGAGIVRISHQDLHLLLKAAKVSRIED